MGGDSEENWVKKVRVRVIERRGERERGGRRQVTGEGLKRESGEEVESNWGGQRRVKEKARKAEEGGEF